MEVFIADTYEDISNQAADVVIQLMTSVEDPLLCPASGDSPVGLYKELVEKIHKNEVNVFSWH